MLYLQTQYNLRDYAADHADWSPRTEAVTFPVQLRHGDRGGYHELCLAVIETSTVYYLHQVYSTVQYSAVQYSTPCTTRTRTCAGRWAGPRPAPPTPPSAAAATT